MLPGSRHESTDDGIMNPFSENLVGGVGIGARDVFQDDSVLRCFHEWSPVTPLQDLDPSDEGDSVYMLQKVEEVGGTLTKVKLLDGGLSWEIRGVGLGGRGFEGRFDGGGCGVETCWQPRVVGQIESWSRRWGP